jgi:hypothetical protein
MLAVMDLKGLLTDVRLESVVCIGERGEFNACLL